MSAYREHTHRSSFCWRSELSDEKKDAIIKWVKSLSDEDAEKLEYLLDDVRLDEQDNAASNSDPNY